MNDLTSLNITQLRELQANVASELKSRQDGEIKKARDQIAAIASSMGLSLRDLMDTAGGRKTQSKTRDPLPVKYRAKDDDSKTWTGRGRQPQWFKDWVAAGNQIDELRVS